MDNFSWYQSLYTYSRPRPTDQDDEDETEAELGSDGDLVSAMISTAVIPRICKLLESGALDPYSAKDIRTLIDLAEQIELSVGREEQKFSVRQNSYMIPSLAINISG